MFFSGMVLVWASWAIMLTFGLCDPLHDRTWVFFELDGKVAANSVTTIGTLCAFCIRHIWGSFFSPNHFAVLTSAVQTFRADVEPEMQEVNGVLKPTGAYCRVERKQTIYSQRTRLDTGQSVESQNLDGFEENFDDIEGLPPALPAVYGQPLRFSRAARNSERSNQTGLRSTRKSVGFLLPDDDDSIDEDDDDPGAIRCRGQTGIELNEVRLTDTDEVEDEVNTATSSSSASSSTRSDHSANLADTASATPKNATTPACSSCVGGPSSAIQEVVRKFLSRGNGISDCKCSSVSRAREARCSQCSISF